MRATAATFGRVPRLHRLAPLLISTFALALGACPAATSAPAAAHPTSSAAAESSSTTPRAASDACVGGIDAQPAGAREIDDPALVAQAVGKPGEGKLCAGKAYEVVTPIVVHRVWQSAKAYTQLGGWWSLQKPQRPISDYRARYAICPEWSPLDAASTCKLKVGARFVLGPGQSAKCADGATFAASAANQVFVPNDSRAGVVLVEGCEPVTPWP